MNKDFKVSVLISGNGSNLQALIDGVKEGILPNIKIVQVISSRKDAYGLKRGELAQIPSYVLEKHNDKDLTDRDENLLAILEIEKPDLIVLAGYLKKINEPVLSAYKDKIINIHPSLLPKYGGPGFYGSKIHEAVIAAKEKETGATVHFVDQGIDTGRVIIQKKLSVNPEDTADSLGKKVLVLEHEILTQAVNKIASKRY